MWDKLCGTDENNKIGQTLWDRKSVIYEEKLVAINY